jgi:hypothetical protein
MRRNSQSAAAHAILAAGAVHLYLFAGPDAFRDIPVIGPLFLLNGIAAAATGLALLVTDASVVTFVGIGYCVATLAAFVVSATNGLFGWTESWVGTSQVVAGFTELGAFFILAALLTLRERRSARPREG